MNKERHKDKNAQEKEARDKIQEHMKVDKRERELKKMIEYETTIRGDNRKGKNKDINKKFG